MRPFQHMAGILLLLVMSLLITSCGAPPEAIDWVNRQTDEAVFSVDTYEPLVALTIDDAPDDDTSTILDVLKRHNATATFFVIGQDVEKYPDLTRRIVDEGHELAHHTMTHEPGVGLEIDEFERQFSQMDSLLNTYGGSRWYRPADGFFTPAMYEVASNYNYTLVLGSIYPVDPVNTYVPYLAGYIIRYATPGDIIILHTNQGRGIRTARALDRAIPKLQERGLNVVSLGRLVDGLSGN